MAVEAVIFDWGGTLTPWIPVDHHQLWLDVCGLHFPADQAYQVATAIHAAETELWQACDQSQQSATLDHLFQRAGIVANDEFLASYFTAWEPHTATDPEAAPLLRELRARDVKVGVLSNTMWPRSAHERVFIRDGIFSLIDGAAYSSELARAKPHAEAFRAAMAAIGVTDPATCVFVGDRPYDDIYGAKRAGMRAVLIRGSHAPAFDAGVPDAVISRLSGLLPHLDSW